MSVYCISCAWPITTEYGFLAKYKTCKSTVRERLINVLTNPSVIVYLTADGAQLSDVSVTKYDWFEETYIYRPSSIKKLGHWFALSRCKPPRAVFVHENCWPFLIKHFANEEVNLDRLFKVCRDIWAPSYMKYHSKFAIHI
jgi:hypothetical protein